MHVYFFNHLVQFFSPHSFFFSIHQQSILCEPVMAPNNTRIVLDPVFVNYVSSPEFTPLTSIGDNLDIKNRMKLMREVVEKPYIGQKLPEIIEEDKTVVHGGYELRLSLFLSLIHI